MKCNRLRLHYDLNYESNTITLQIDYDFQFNRNRRLVWRINLEIFTLHHCALNCGCCGWVSSFIIVCYWYVSAKTISRLCALNPEIPAGSTFAANSRFVAATLPVGRQK